MSETNIIYISDGHLRVFAPRLNFSEFFLRRSSINQSSIKLLSIFRQSSINATGKFRSKHTVVSSSSAAAAGSSSNK